MKTTTIKMLSILAVFAMAFAFCGVVATDAGSVTWDNQLINDSPDAEELAAGTYILKADGKIYSVSGQTETDTGKVYANGIYCKSGELVLKIADGATITIDGLYFGIFSQGSLKIVKQTPTGAASALVVNVNSENAENAKLTQGEPAALGIGAKSAVTVEDISMQISANATSSTASGSHSYGIYSDSTVSLTGEGSIYGGCQGVYAASNITINGDFDFAGYERGIRSYGTVTIGNSSATTVDAYLLDGEGVNGAGTDSRFGIKAEVTLTTGNNGTVVDTMGLYVTTAITPAANDKIIVKGGYEQTKAADASKPYNAIVGYVCTAAEVAESNANLKHISKIADATAGKISIMEGAEVYNYVISGYSEKYEPAAGTSIADISAKLKTDSSTYKEAYLDLKSIESADLDKLTIPSGMNVKIIPAASKNYGGQIVLTDKTSTVQLIGVTIAGTATNEVSLLSIKGGDSNVITLTPATAGQAVSMTVGYGSVEVKDITTTGALALDVNGTVKIKGTVSAGAIVTINKATGAESANVIITSELYNSGSITFGEVGISAEAEIVNSTSTAKFIFGEKTVIDSQIIINGGNIQGIIAGSTLVLKGAVTASGAITVNGKMTVGEGATLTMGGNNLTISDGAKLNVYGKITGNSVVNNGTIYILSKDAEIPKNISGTGTIEFDVVEEIIEIKGSIRTSEFDDYQAVYIVGDSSIVENSIVVVNGKIIVNPGVTLTITDGSLLAVLNSYGKIVNYGTIIVQAGGATDADPSKLEGLYVNNATFDNYGTISFQYTPATGTTPAYSGSFGTSAIINNYGTFSIAEYDIVDLGYTAAIAAFNNHADATLLIGGAIVSSAGTITVTNYGDVVINGVIDAVDNVTIAQVANGATVTITKLTGGASATQLTISDDAIAGVTKKTFKGYNNVVITADAKNSFGGLIVSTTTKMGSTANYVYMDLAGALDAEIAEGDAAATVAMSGDYVTMGSIMTSTKEITLTGNLTVNGVLTLEEGKMYKTSGALTVFGTVIAGKSPIDAAITINAAMFVTGTTSKTYTYTTLDQAIEGASAAGVNTITATGKVAVSASIDIPAGMTVKQTSGTITVGTALNNTVVLTVEDGAKLEQTAGTIVVYGTLYVENKNTGIKKSPSVVADVKAEGTTDLMYTNLIVALSITPTEPVTVTLFNDVTITSDLIIPEFVTLDTNSKDLTVYGAKLTINGTLFLNGGNYSVVDDETGAVKKNGEIVLNGYIKNADFMSYDDKKYPAGAYFSLSVTGTYYYITTVENAATFALLADDNTIGIYGKNTVGDVSFEGTSDEPVIINVNGGIVSGSFGLSFATMNIAQGLDINMTVSGELGSIAFKNASTAAKTVIRASAILGVPTLGIESGSIKEASTVTELKNYNTTFDGTVLLKSVSIVKGKIDGTVIASDNKVVFTDTTTVNGNLVADNACSITMANVKVLGTLAANEATSSKSAGSVEITGTLTTGNNEYAGNGASVSGNISADNYVIYDGTTFDGVIADTLDALMDKGQYTEFYVLDELWFTFIYKSSQPNVKISSYVPKGLIDSDFKNWQYISSGELTDIDKTAKIGTYKEVYALIKYDIYDVTIITDAGVKSVAINGIELKNESSGNVFEAPYELTAGTYKVTYTLKSGYQGTAILSTSTGTVLKDNSFVLSGTEAADRDVTFQLAGTEPIPEPEPTPTPEEKSEWTVTTILLCVLVVLIAIMAVIVALRLNRN